MDTSTALPRIPTTNDYVNHLLTLARSADERGETDVAHAFTVTAAALAHKTVADLEGIVRMPVGYEELAKLPIHSMGELEAKYQEHVKHAETRSFNFNGWLPSLGRVCRALVPGELVVILADTGVGKTCLLQNLAMRAAPQQVLLFELELPGTLTYERFLQMHQGMIGDDIFHHYRRGETLDWRGLNHVWTCSESRMTCDKIESYIVKSQDKIGGKPTIVLVDYIGLVQSGGSSKRYERISDVAEQLKVVAKQTDSIIIMASQLSRPEDKNIVVEPRLHQAKDSGSIENSAGLVLGAWRDTDDHTRLWLKVLKNTKGRSGKKIACRFDVTTMRIDEAAEGNEP